MIAAILAALTILAALAVLWHALTEPPGTDGKEQR